MAKRVYMHKMTQILYRLCERVGAMTDDRRNASERKTFTNTTSKRTISLTYHKLTSITTFSHPLTTMSDEAPLNEAAAKDEEKQTEEEEAKTEERTARVEGLPLDWTQLGGDPSAAPVIRYPSDVIDIDKEETELLVVGTAGRKITHMGKELWKELHPDTTRPILRSHVIRTMEGLQGLQKLELLELYDNQVDALQCLDEGPDGAPGPTLRVLDMSYNVIRDMQPVEVCPNLQELCKS